MHTTRFREPARAAFTLIELMVSMAVLAIIMIISVQVLGQTQKTWRQGVSRLEQFREARMAFDSITQNLRQAGLNTYLTYKYNDGSTPTVPASKDETPKQYIRQSELQFITGPVATLLPGSPGGALVTHAVFFQARLGVSDRDGYEALNRLLCGRGYFIMQGNDDAYRPAPVSQRRTRFRLWEYRPPSEENTVYSAAPGKWFSDAVNGAVSTSDSTDHPANTRPVAENIIALILSPQVTSQDTASSGKKVTWIAPEYFYDSTQMGNVSSDNPQGTQHLLPPIMMVTMVAIDEVSARLLDEEYHGTLPQLVPAGSFAHADSFQADLKALEEKLQEEKLNYRVFSAAIPMRNSKWSILK